MDSGVIKNQLSLWSICKEKVTGGTVTCVVFGEIETVAVNIENHGNGMISKYCIGVRGAVVEQTIFVFYCLFDCGGLIGSECTKSREQDQIDCLLEKRDLTICWTTLSVLREPRQGALTPFSIL